MKKIGILCFAFYPILLQSCHMSPGYAVTMAPWIAKSNATQVQKDAMWDGCAMANTREFNPTNIRHTGRVEIDSAYLNDNNYNTAWRYGNYYCAMIGGGINGSYTRSWNALGFKGGAVNYKSQ